MIPPTNGPHRTAARPVRSYRLQLCNGAVADCTQANVSGVAAGSEIV